MPGRGRLAPSLDGLFVATFALLGVRLGSVPVGDNSALWHIRTGIDALAGAGIPRSDPYSWTAAGQPWVVQSWLAELVYGVAHRLGGFGGVVALNAVVLGVVAGAMAALAATGRPRRTLLSAGLAVGLSAGWWSPRPLLFGLALLALTIGLALRGAPGWAFVPVGMIWVSMHGSFVLGPTWLVLAAVGRAAADRWGRSTDEGAGHRGWQGALGDLGRATALGAGAVVGAVLSPPGWRLLVFPFNALTRRRDFAAVIEWQRPDLLAGPVELLALAALLAAAAVMVVTRPPLRLVLPAVAFAGAGLVAQRNMAAAGVALAPALAAGLRGWRPARPTPLAPANRGLHRALAGLIAAAAALFVVIGATGPGLDLDGYPVAAVRWMDDQGLRDGTARIVHTDVAGGFLILRDGRRARVFIDDRVDMYPDRLLADYRRMVAGDESALPVLDELEVDAVLWPVDEPLDRRLAAAPHWRRAVALDGWEVWLRR